MSQQVNLKAADGKDLQAYVAKPTHEPLGAVVVIQEIFGVNSHIRNVTDQFAEQGYVAIAPALFDRIERGVELKYEGEDMQKAYGLYGQLKPETALLDVAAAFEHVKEFGKGVAVVGFCYGGYMSWLSATRGESLDPKMSPKCCVGYYPGGVGLVATEQPSCPVLLHFGLADTHIGADQREAVAKAHPKVEIFTYEGAEHGFNCDARASFNATQSAIARERTLAFLKTHLA